MKNKLIQKVSTRNCAQLLRDLRHQGLSSHTIQGVYVLLGSIFSHAQSRGLLSESPLKRLTKTERPKAKTQSKATCLTSAEAKSLYAKAVYRNESTIAQPMIALGLGSGLRLSELLGLTWQDVHLTEGTVNVRFQLSVAKGSRPAERVTLKTEKAQREVFLPPETVRALKTHKADRFALGLAGPANFVFGTKDGNPLSQHNAARALKTAAKAAGLEGVSWHDLRHTCISRWIAAGLDVYTVSRMAGHAKASTTLDIYTHEFEAAKRSDGIRARIAATGGGLS